MHINFTNDKIIVESHRERYQSTYRLGTAKERNLFT